MPLVYLYSFVFHGNLYRYEYIFYHGVTAPSPPQWAKASSLSRLHDHTQTHHTWQDSSGRVISPTQRPLLANTQHSQQTDIHVSGGIRTHNPNKRASADQQVNYISKLYLEVFVKYQQKKQLFE